MTLSVTGEESRAPAVESRGGGDVRAWYYQTSGGGNDDGEEGIPESVGRQVEQAQAVDLAEHQPPGTSERSLGFIRRKHAAQPCPNQSSMKRW